MRLVLYCQCFLHAKLTGSVMRLVLYSSECFLHAELTGSVMRLVGVPLFLPPGQLGDPCLRSTECSAGLCCARHFWDRICKPVLKHGEVCTRHGRKGQELFQRCDCGEGLACQALRTALPSSSPSSSSKSIAAAAKARLYLCQRE